MPAIIVDRYGRRIEPDDGIVPDGGRVIVPAVFMDSRAAQVRRAFLRDGVRHAPGWAEGAIIGDGFEATSSLERSQSAAEEARQRWIMALSEAWKTPTYARAVSKNTKPGLATYDDPDEGTSDADPPERAYERMKARLSDAWKGTPVADNAAEGVALADLPDDVQQLPLDQQEAYCQAHNQYLEEHPDASPEECDAVGRAAVGTASPSDSLAACEAVRDAAWRRSVERVTNAWRQT